MGKDPKAKDELILQFNMARISLAKEEEEEEEEESIVVSIKDVTESKEAEEKITKAAQEWRATFDSITDMLLITDKDYKIIRVNMAFANAFKMKPQELIGRNCYEVVHGTKEPSPYCHLKRTLEAGKPVKSEFFEPHLGIHLELTTSPVFNERGEVTGVIHLIKDITERKRAEERMLYSEKLAGIGELAAGIAHEIRNPLGNISASAQICLGKYRLNEEVQKFLNVILRNSENANRIIKDLLDFARPSQLSLKIVNVGEVIDKVCNLVKARCSKQRVRLRRRWSRRLPGIIMDENRMEQAFLNIILNSLDAMEEGGRIFISAYPEGDEVVVTFSDTGRGIPKSDIDKIFNPFFSTKKDGTGLGLSVTHQAIIFHKGRIEIESEADRGTDVTVRLPINLEI